MLACTTGNENILKIMVANILGRKSVKEKRKDLDRFKLQTMLNHRNENGINCMYVCASYGHLKALKILREQGAQFDKSLNGTNLLHISSKQGHLEIVKYITQQLGESGQINNRQHNGETAVMLATRKDHADVVKYLYSQGADLQLGFAIKDKCVVDLMYLAALYGSHQVMTFLFDTQQFPDPIIFYKQLQHPTALLVATVQGFHEVVEVILTRYPRIIRQLD